jgi:peptidoglycan-associated lipoprotein
MMKKVAYMSAVLALLVFSGCSTKEPTIDASTANSTGSSTAAAATTESSAAVAPADVSGSSTVIAPVSNTNGTDSTASTANSSANGQGINSVLFDFDKFDIREDMQAVMMTNSGLLKGKTFKLEGNCDEFGSDEYNFALGLKRANTVKTGLVNNGVSADAISMTSLGEGNPVCTEKTQECWAKNRRVDIKLP